MFNRKRSGRWTDSTTWAVFLTVGTGLLAFTPGSLARHIITGAMFAIAVTGLLADVVGRILLRRAARAGSMKGRHSVTDHGLRS
ncbi:hypothetical protein GCM10010495_73700 [Kitasatospora herbaricolor]|uniref:hypothetical protein n=1 Tax=Kitasatospora herbaricolor TaxID=68217 RepID=UPI00174C48A7|nr:hypothetical protein [Kitasatospora herbaricolor]MDQ0305639.1 hypothetical protein [Kitasatospora herbaricolor]GGV45415.1 hypothetical protein GCM10010495_73700 [Kitasatospora herbaricolor]